MEMAKEEDGEGGVNVVIPSSDFPDFEDLEFGVLGV